jgi:hypothetical protein
MDGGDASWRSAENPVDRRISQICEKVKAECLLAFRHFGISGFGISAIPMTRSWGTLH